MMFTGLSLDVLLIEKDWLDGALFVLEDEEEVEKTLFITQEADVASAEFPVSVTFCTVWRTREMAQLTA
jgi:hypothetical protein